MLQVLHAGLLLGILRDLFASLIREGAQAEGALRAR